MHTIISLNTGHSSAQQPGHLNEGHTQPAVPAGDNGHLPKPIHFLAFEGNIYNPIPDGKSTAGLGLTPVPRRMGRAA